MTLKLGRILVVAVLTFALAGNFSLQAQQAQQQQPPPEAKVQTAPQQPPPAKTVLFQPGVDLDSGQSTFPNIFKPYTPLRIDRPVLENTPRVENLIKEGQMILTLEDAISLALENNLDIIVERYTPWIAEAGVLRAKAGLGTASGGFDPQLSSTFSWFRGSQPVLNPFLAGTGVLQQLALTNYRTDANFGYTQGFPTGTAYSITFNNSRQSTTSASQLFNPAVQSFVSFAFQQPLLNGLGFVSNKRFLRLARNTKRISDLGFNNQIILTVSAVQSMYWNLVFAREDVKVKQRSVELAHRTGFRGALQFRVRAFGPDAVSQPPESELDSPRHGKGYSPSPIRIDGFISPHLNCSRSAAERMSANGSAPRRRESPVE